MARKSKQNSVYKNCYVSIVNGDEIETFPLLDIVVNDLEYENGFLPISDGVKYFDKSTGGLHYIFNLDVPAKVEAANLKLLRRSSAIHNIFNYDLSKPLDIFKFLPWVAIILLILFK